FSEGYVWQLVLLNKGLPWAIVFVVLGVIALLVRPVLVVEVARASANVSAEADAAPAPDLHNEPHLGGGIDLRSDQPWPADGLIRCAACGELATASSKTCRHCGEAIAETGSWSALRRAPHL